ncbi:methyl-accepting chemotaxis protein [Gimibacter soli]|uniref:Methyl-accepting chemotaxis protein n=1 Tax=Gimibacter soli TaxID=3024400 RepID=A0AAE9XTF8_9PROT|nr:methyl-accepting chemotaxis protein [Gimibacter soli]WCL54850.1 methyl-accepting chemotaxis protein [Gimibacter soli]
MSRFDKLSISRRIAAGFGAVIALFFIVTLVASLELFTGRYAFAEYRATARQAVQAGRVQANLLLARIAAKDFLIAASDDAANRVKDRTAQTLEAQQELMAMMEGSAHSGFVAEAGNDIRAYSEHFEQITSLEREKHVLVSEKLDRLGPDLQSGLLSIGEAARVADNMALMIAVNEALYPMMMMRLHANKYLLSGNEHDYTQAMQHAAAAGEGLSDIPAAPAASHHRDAVTALDSSRRDYTETFQQLKGLTDTRNDVVRNKLDVTGRAVADDLEAFKLDIKKEQDTLGPETDAALQFGLIFTIIVSLVAIGLGVWAAVFIGRGIARPIVAITGDVDALAADNLDIHVSGRNRADEIGKMAAGLEIFREKLLDNRRMAEQEAARAEEERLRKIAEEETRAEREREKEAQMEAERKRQAYIDGLIRDFDSAAMALLSTLGQAGRELQETASLMSSTAEETGTQATTVASAAQQTAAHVQAVATSAEELSASIHEISRQVSRSSELAQVAVDEGRSADAGIKGLVETADRISNVVQLINDIAEQTNLLALNATIEAARAGDAGRGFAVVASEVKSLAQHTAKATEEITTQVSEIQAETQKAVSSIDRINRTIASMNEISSMIAAAVEEQGAATNEIATTVQQTAAGTDDVTSNIQGVSEAAQTTGSAATQVLSSANRLVDQSGSMSSTISTFLDNIRKAS